MMQWQSALRALVQTWTRHFVFHGSYEYRVMAQDGAVLDLQPVRAATGLPPLRRVAVWPGLAGASSTVVGGSSVLVSFVDGDPARPFITGLAPTNGAGFVPVDSRIQATETITLGDGDPKGAARLDDSVAIGQLTVGGVGGVTLQFTPAGGDPSAPSTTVNITGRVSSASTKVRIQ